MDDRELVELASGGDREAFAELYDRYAPRLHDFVSGMLRDRHEAADVVHDTFLTAGARLHQLRDPGKVRPWLYAIARREALRTIGRRKRTDLHEEPQMIHDHERSGEAGGDPGAGLRQQELRDLIAAAAAGLSERDRTVLDLHLRHGLEGRELAAAMGASPDQSYVVVSRLKDQLERALGALLVARQGRDDCDDLAALLVGWDGRFSPLWRKRVARHVDDCEICQRRRAVAFSPATLLGAVPLIALPPGLRERVLGDVDLVSHQGVPWSARRGGFPPPPWQDRRRPTGLVRGAAVALIVLLAALVVAPNGDQTLELVPASADQTGLTKRADRGAAGGGGDDGPAGEGADADPPAGTPAAGGGTSPEGGSPPGQDPDAAAGTASPGSSGAKPPSGGARRPRTGAAAPPGSGGADPPTTTATTAPGTAPPASTTSTTAPPTAPPTTAAPPPPTTVPSPPAPPTTVRPPPTAPPTTVRPPPTRPTTTTTLPPRRG